MEADHTLVQIQGKGRGTVDLIQGMFTQIKNKLQIMITFKIQRQLQCFDITPQCI